MAYADFEADDIYSSKVSGAALEILIINEDDPTDVLIGATTGLNSTDEFETNPVEEAGDDGVNEHVQGRHTGQGSTSAFFTPEWNDNLPTRQNFLGRGFTVLRRYSEEHGNAKGKAFAETVLDAYTGVKINRVGSQQGARGNVTMEIAFVFERRYTGKEWAALTGT